MSRFLRAACLHAAAVSCVALTFAGCAFRATDKVAGAFTVPPGVKLLRVEIENATLDVGLPLEGAPTAQITFKGGVRMDAADDAQLHELMLVEHGLVAALDPEDPTVFVVKGPRTPSKVRGMIAYEGNLRVPASMPLEVVVANNGHVTMVGRRAACSVQTRRGDLRFEDCAGGIKATTGQGNVIAYDHRGDLDVRSQGGDMQVFVIEPGDRLTLSTGKGTVQCYVPKSIDCQVDARAEIGRIGNDFGFEVKKPTAYSSAMIGSRGRPKTRVLLRTAAGHIAMRALEPR